MEHQCLRSGIFQSCRSHLQCVNAIPFLVGVVHQIHYAQGAAVPSKTGWQAVVHNLWGLGL